MRKLTRILGLSGLLLTLLVALTPVAVNAQGSCDLGSSVLVGTLISGINCIDEAGWHVFQLKSGIFDITSVDDVSVCPDTGNILAIHTFGMNQFDGANWTEIELPAEVIAVDTLVCAEGGEIWIAHTGGLTHFDGTEWSTFTDDQFGTGEFIFGVGDVAVGADGSVWAITNSSIARLGDDGATWEVFEDGQGINGVYSMSDLDVNSDGLPVVAHSQGVLRFDGTSWTPDEAPLLSVQEVLVDNENRVWVGSFSEGVSVNDGSGWTTYNMESGLTSNNIHALATDAAGRIWVGTEWGLNVLDGETWSSYTMANSDLLDNAVHFVGVLGDGVTTLPATVEKDPGSVVGIIEISREPVPDAQVELCAGTVGSIFYGDSPCADIPGSMLTTTDENGQFTFENVPVGRYNLTINGPDGWIYFIGADSDVDVISGEQTDLEFIDIGQ